MSITKVTAVALMSLAFLGGCRSMSENESADSAIKDLRDGSDWCYVNLRAIDGTAVNIDYKIDGDRATPVWFNYHPKNDGKAAGKTEVVVIPYKIENGKKTEFKSVRYDLKQVPSEKKLTVDIPGGLEIGQGNHTTFYEFAFVSNGAWLKDPLSGMSNFRVDFAEINRINKGRCVAQKPATAPTAPSTATQLTIQKPSGMYRMTAAEISKVVAALRQARYAFYEDGSGYDIRPVGQKVPPIEETIRCMNVAPDRWSDLAAHYYGLFPGYASGFFPNIRECYSYLVSPNTSNKISGKKPGPKEAHEYCTYMPIDRKGMKEDGEQYNWATVITDAPILTQRTIPQGPFAWIAKNQPDVFPFIMFTTPCSIHPESQQEVLNQFYGVSLQGKNSYTATDTAQVQECRNKRPVRNRFDSTDGTHCSYSMRKAKHLAEQCNY